MDKKTKELLGQAEALLKDLQSIDNQAKGLELYQQLAQDGVAEAMYALFDYYWGKDAKKSAQYLEQAVEKGYPPALFTRGSQYYYDDDEEGLGKAMMCRAAIAGEPQAQHWLASCYCDGLGGVTIDLEKAFFWYKSAADKGYADSVYCLANCYLQGMGTNKDVEKGRALLQTLVDDKELSDAARTSLALSLLDDPDEEKMLQGIQMMESDARDEPKKVCMYIAEQREGLDRWPSAIFLYNRAGDLGEPEGYYRAARLHLLLKQTNQVEPLLRKAAEAGCDKAQYTLFRVYGRGMYGVPASTDRALAYLRQAAQNGHCKACHQLGNLYTLGVGQEIPQDFREARKWYTLALSDPAYRGAYQVRELLSLLNP